MPRIQELLLHSMNTNGKKNKKGSFSWGITTNQAYLPVDHDYFFNKSISLVEWLRQYSKTEEEGRIIYKRFSRKDAFSGDEALKKSNVLSGGEKCVVCYQNDDGTR